MRLIDIEPFETEKGVTTCQITRWRSGDGYAEVVTTNTKDIPAADVAPVVHGEWEMLGDKCANCTNCGTIFEALPTEYVFKANNKFCRNCGADMRERKGDDG